MLRVTLLLQFSHTQFSLTVSLNLIYDFRGSCVAVICFNCYKKQAFLCNSSPFSPSHTQTYSPPCTSPPPCTLPILVFSPPSVLFPSLCTVTSSLYYPPLYSPLLFVLSPSPCTLPSSLYFLPLIPILSPPFLHITLHHNGDIPVSHQSQALSCTFPQCLHGDLLKQLGSGTPQCRGVAPPQCRGCLPNAASVVNLTRGV